jgi:hypothetical protein
VRAMDRSLSSPAAPSGGELLITSALLSVYVGLRVATAALAVAGNLPSSRGRSGRARE